LSPDGQTLATCAADESLKFWKTFEAKPKAKKKIEDEDLAMATSKLAIR
jgi:WD40 repeat protein